MAERTHTISEFRGLNEYASPEEQVYTRSLENVLARYSRVFGRRGIEKLRDISTVSSTTPIIGLAAYSSPALATTLIRLTPTKIESLNTGTDVWDDITGSAFTGASTDTPKGTMHKDVLCISNGGTFRPRKWEGSGNTVVLGGTPPFAEAIADNWGFLFLFNISDDGTTFFPRRATYSDDFDNSWSNCEGAELNFNETNGEILTANAFGDYIVVFKSDILMQLHFVGGLARFTQFPLPFDHGLIAPLSPAKVGELGIPFLDTSYRLNITDGRLVKPAPPFVQRKLDETLVKADAHLSVGLAYPDNDTYSLFYSSAAADTWNRSRISFNFRTGEFNHATYAGHEFIRAITFRYASTSSNIIAASTNDLVYQLDTDQEKDDGTVIDRHYDIDWNQLGFKGEKTFKGASLYFRKNSTGRVAISVARDFRADFRYRKMFDLRGLPVSGDYVTVPYRIDPGISGEFFSVRIQFYHDDGTVVELTPPAHIHFEALSTDMKSRSDSRSALET